MIDWVQGNGFPTADMPGLADYDNNSAWWTIQGTYGGWFHVYAFTMTMGIILAVAYSAWKFYRKGIPLTQLALGVVIIVPCSLFGASIFGKLNAIAPGVNANYCSTAGLFAFWHAGMAIHGGVYVGTAVGVITFGIMGYFTKTSLWVYMDAIIPNILLGQGLGRWGNFFNHEVMGAPIADVTGSVVNGQLATSVDASKYILHLPHYINVNTSVAYSLDAPDKWINGVHLIPGHVYEMAPIFLYESISLFIAWGLITFVLPNIGKWFGPKPWKKYRNNFKFSWSQTFLNFFTFWKFPTKTALYEKTTAIYSEGEMPTYKDQPLWAQSWFVIWKQAYEYNPNLDQRDGYENEIKKAQSSTKNNTIKRNRMGKALTEANNPDRYWTTKPGIEACAYFLLWNVVRFALELQRPDDHLFIMFEKTLSLCLIGVTGFLGLLGMILTQTRVVTRFFRQPGYLYEKEYFRAERIQKHWWFFIINLKYKTLYDMKAFLTSVISIMSLGIIISSAVMYGTNWEDRHWIPAVACEFAFTTIALISYVLLLSPALLRGEIKKVRIFGFLLTLIIFAVSIVGLSKSSYDIVQGFEYIFTPIAIWLALANFVDGIREYNAEVLPVNLENTHKIEKASPKVSKIFSGKYEEDLSNGPTKIIQESDNERISAAELKAQAKLAKMEAKQRKTSSLSDEEAEAQARQRKAEIELMKLEAELKEIKSAKSTKDEITKSSKNVEEKQLSKAEIKQRKAAAKLAKMEAKQKQK